MKTRLDPRHKNRQEIVKKLFAYSFSSSTQSNTRIVEILEKKDLIDTTIEKIAPEFPIDKLNKVDLAVLRLAVFELAVEKKEPPKVIIDEAIELAKEFGGDTSPGFVNGALGKLLKELE